MNLQILKQSFRRLLGLVALLVALGLAGTAQAATFNMVFTGGTDPNNANAACATTTTACIYHNVVVDQNGTALASTSPYQRDAIVTRAAPVSAVITDFDQETGLPVGGKAQYFEPVVSRLNFNNTTQSQGYGRFTFTFYVPVAAGATPTTVKALDGGVFISALDLDGTGVGSAFDLNEFVRSSIQLL